MNWLDRVLRGHSNEPSSEVRGDATHVQEVEAILAELRPMFRADAGDIQLLSIVDGTVHVRLAGACETCHASDMTLYAALEPRLRERCAWFRDLRAG